MFSLVCWPNKLIGVPKVPVMGSKGRRAPPLVALPPAIQGNPGPASRATPQVRNDPTEKSLRPASVIKGAPPAVPLITYTLDDLSASDALFGLPTQTVVPVTL